MKAFFDVSVFHDKFGKQCFEKKISINQSNQSPLVKENTESKDICLSPATLSSTHGVKLEKSRWSLGKETHYLKMKYIFNFISILYLSGYIHTPEQVDAETRTFGDRSTYME